MTIRPDTLLRLKLLAARMAILFEDAWVALWPAMAVASVAVIAVLSGVVQWLPLSWRYVVAGAAAVAVMVALKPVLRLRWPARTRALARIEERSHLRHRPLRSLDDRLSETNPSPAARGLWREHQRRLKTQVKALKAGVPRSRLWQVDRLAIRNTLAIAVIAAAIVNFGNWQERIKATFAGIAPKAAISAVDAWISAPPYTRRAPVLLTRAGKVKANGEELVTPEGSILFARVNGADKAELVMSTLASDGGRGEEIGRHRLKADEDGAALEIRTALDRPVHVSLEVDGKSVAAWPVSIIADAAPTVAIAGPLKVTVSGAFSLPWKVSDDYGVASLRGEVRLVHSDDMGKKALPFAPPRFAVAMRKLNPLKASGRTFQDLSAHPWAGLEVEISLVARDQAGQETRSAPLKVRLPQRGFSNPIAQVIVEQRRNLVRNPSARTLYMRALAALLIWPQGLINKSGHYLGLQEAVRQLYSAYDEVALKRAVKDLWELAVFIEDGDMSQALRELDAVRKELQKALAEGAPPARIAELMKKLRAAMDRYLQAMARQMAQAMRDGRNLDNLSRQPDREISSRDLKRMMDMIENLARSGARDAAQEMLSQLEALMKNLQPGIANRLSPQRMSPMARMLERLGEMMRKQQGLMDKTFRNRRQLGQPGQRVPGGSPLDQQYFKGDRRAGELAGEQESLGKMLEKLLKRLGQRGLNPPDGLKQSQESMKGAADALRRNAPGEALTRQGQALSGLRQGARAMARQLMQQGVGNNGNYGRHGEARGDSRDPLGRPFSRRSGVDYGPERDMLPSERAVEQARRILEFLRKRAGEPNRRRIEIDYYDRLLRGLY